MIAISRNQLLLEERLIRGLFGEELLDEKEKPIKVEITRDSKVYNFRIYIKDSLIGERDVNGRGVPGWYVQLKLKNEIKALKLQGYNIEFEYKH